MSELSTIITRENSPSIYIFMDKILNTMDEINNKLIKNNVDTTHLIKVRDADDKIIKYILSGEGFKFDQNNIMLYTKDPRIFKNATPYFTFPFSLIGKSKENIVAWYSMIIVTDIEKEISKIESDTRWRVIDLKNMKDIALNIKLEKELEVGYIVPIIINKSKPDFYGAIIQIILYEIIDIADDDICLKGIYNYNDKYLSYKKSNIIDIIENTKSEYGLYGFTKCNFKITYRDIKYTVLAEDNAHYYCKSENGVYDRISKLCAITKEEK